VKLKTRLRAANTLVFIGLRVALISAQSITQLSVMILTIEFRFHAAILAKGNWCRKTWGFESPYLSIEGYGEMVDTPVSNKAEPVLL